MLHSVHTSLCMQVYDRTWPLLKGASVCVVRHILRLLRRWQQARQAPSQREHSCHGIVRHMPAEDLTGHDTSGWVGLHNVHACASVNSPQVQSPFLMQEHRHSSH
jgi:uncharacterized protein YfaT (DUF1175 family)